MTIRFYLHNKAADHQHPIYIEVRWAQHAAAEPSTQPAVRMGVRETCAKKYWTKKQRVSTQDEGRCTRINRKLSALYKVAEKLLDDAAALRTKLKWTFAQ